MLLSRLSVAALMIATAFLAGCTAKEDASASPSPSAPAQNQTLPAPVALTVTARDTPPQAAQPGSTRFYAWTPALSAKLNATIELTLRGESTNQLTHNLRLEGYPEVQINGVKANSATFTFNATKAGPYKYYCAVGAGSPTAHRSLGMEGTLTIA